MQPPSTTTMGEATVAITKPVLATVDAVRQGSAGVAVI